MKKILFFAPHGNWHLHHQVDAAISSSLQLRGAEVLFVYCGRVFKECPNARGKETFCKVCLSESKNIVNFFKVPSIALSSVLQEKDYIRCSQWTESLKGNELLDAKFEGKDLGEYVNSGVCSYLLISKPDFSEEKTIKIYKNFLYNAALVKISYDKLIKKMQPDHIVCFHAKISHYSVFFELARQDNIPVLVHERGSIDDSFMFLENGHEGLPAGRPEAMSKWKEIPLSHEECKKVKKLLKEREDGKNHAIPAFYRSNHLQFGELRKSLRLPKDSIVIAVFLASDWELGMYKELCINFTSIIIAIKDIIKNLAKWPDVYIVFRHHPNVVGDNHTGFTFLKQLFHLNRTRPETVRVIMPKEKITSYELMWFADAVISFGSTAGVEAILRGLPTVSNVDIIYNFLDMGLERVLTPDSYLDSLKKAISKKQSNELNFLKKAYRGFYFYFYRLSNKFKSIGIKDHYKCDIKINSINELSEGNDPALDRVCNYLLKGSPLFSVPGELEKSRSDNEETVFLQRELDIIYQKRKEVKNKNILNNYKEPLITVLRMRLDGAFIKEKNGIISSIFLQSLNKSRHKNIELNDMASPYYYDLTSFFKELIVYVDMAKGKYIYLGKDYIHIDESLFSTSIDYLEEPENISCDGIVTGSWICDNNGNIITELFTQRRDTNNFSDSLKRFPLFSDPKYALTFYVWRKKSLQKIIKILEKSTKNFNEFSENLYRQTMTDHAQFKFIKSLIPNISIYVPLLQKI